MKSYLIQRGTSYDLLNYQADDKKNGIDKLVKWDYMGSAEFEFGSLFKSMQRVRNDIVSYELYTHETTMNGYPVYVFCKQSKKDEVFAVLNELVDFNKSHYGLKEHINFYKWFNPSINVPPKKKLKKIRIVRDKTLYTDEKGVTFYERYKNDDKIIWSEARNLENFWFDIENDFMFFVDKSSCLKRKFLECFGRS